MTVTRQQILKTADEQRNKILSNSLPYDNIPRECISSIESPVPQFVRIITGIRRCGKSTFVCQDLKNRSENSFYLNFDDPALAEFDSSSFLIFR